MEQLNEIQSIMGWIHKHVDPILPYRRGFGVHVSSCMPKGFSRYVKIFHAIYEDLSIKDKNLTWDNSKDQPLRKNPPYLPKNPIEEILKSGTLVHGSPRKDFPRRRVRWEQLCTELHISFHKELNENSFTSKFETGSWPRYLVGPNEGCPDKQSLASLVKVVSKIIRPQKWFFYYVIMATSGLRDDLVFRSDLQDFFMELPSLLVDTVHCSPTYWFPQDHSCLICSDWDLPFTLVGGDEELTQSILDDTDLESMEIMLSDRVDYFADQLNK